MDTKDPGRIAGRRVLSIVGRFGVAILLAGVGLVVGLAIGAYRALMAVNALPPSPATMGFESAGFAPFLLFCVHLALGAVVGAAVGLVVGVAGAILWPRARG